MRSGKIHSFTTDSHPPTHNNFNWPPIIETFEAAATTDSLTAYIRLLELAGPESVDSKIEQVLDLLVAPNNS